MSVAPLPVPGPPISPEEVRERYPVLRQSILSKFDACPLSTLFELRHSNGWSTTPQARGTLMHRFYAECLRTMVRTGERRMPTEEAMVILREVIRQRDVPLHERVRVPLRELPVMRMEALKWVRDNEFNVDRIVAVEERLNAELPLSDGRTRTLTGQLDALLFDPPDGAIVLDWKSTWALPPETREGVPDQDDPSRISFEGYFQQRFYGYLVLRAYPAVQRVTLREFYTRRSKVRSAVLLRSDMEHVEHDLAQLVEAFDDSLAAGARNAGTGLEGDGWPATPGKPCAWCAKPGACPIEREARGDGAIQSAEQAERYAAEREVAERVRGHRTGALKSWVDVHGPVPVKHSKGRMMIGWSEKLRGGRVFGTFVPDQSDRGPKDPEMEQSMTASVEEARRLRDERKARR